MSWRSHPSSAAEVEKLSTLINEPANAQTTVTAYTPDSVTPSTAQVHVLDSFAHQLRSERQVQRCNGSSQAIHNRASGRTRSLRGHQSDLAPIVGHSGQHAGRRAAFTAVGASQRAEASHAAQPVHAHELKRPDEQEPVAQGPFGRQTAVRMSGRSQRHSATMMQWLQPIKHEALLRVIPNKSPNVYSRCAFQTGCRNTVWNHDGCQHCLQVTVAAGTVSVLHVGGFQPTTAPAEGNFRASVPTWEFFIGDRPHAPLIDAAGRRQPFVQMADVDRLVQKGAPSTSRSALR